MNNQFSRTRPIFPDGKYEDLISKKILVFGTGGVGSAAVEALVRFGFKSISFVDYDRVDESNLNRQIFSNRANVGMFKCLAMKDRMLAINPNLEVKYFIKKLTDNFDIFDLKTYDVVIDAIDTVSSKINLIEFCSKNKIALISSMGTGNRLDPGKLQIMDVYETSYDPLSKVIRHELRKRGIKKQKVVSSLEAPALKSKREPGANRSTPFSVSYVPPVAGYILAGEVIRILTEW